MRYWWMRGRRAARQQMPPLERPTVSILRTSILKCANSLPHYWSRLPEKTDGWLNPSDFIAKHSGAPEDDVGRSAQMPSPQSSPEGEDVFIVALIYSIFPIH